MLLLLVEEAEPEDIMERSAGYGLAVVTEHIQHLV
jgi:hypothetical protein